MHNIRAQASSNRVRWEISQAAIDRFNPLIESFTRQSPYPKIRKRDEARQALEQVLRPFIQGHLEHNPLVTDDDLTAMGLPVHDRKPTPPEPPKDEPELDVKPAPAGVIEIIFGDKNEHGHELRWAILDAPLADWSELLHSEISTRSPFQLSFEGHDRGKRIYLAGRWENSRGAKGPWTEIISTVIP